LGVDLARLLTPMLAAFMTSLVEFIEALTVVLAVGAVRGWRGALSGSALALLVLTALVVILGPAFTRIPQDYVQLGIGTLMLLFGMRWLRKAILRAAGHLPLHDEMETYARELAAQKDRGRVTQQWDRVAAASAFNITMLEGIEVVFIVVAVGAAGQSALRAASIGAGAALALVVALGILLHRPVAMLPENILKFIVGVMLCAFGTFWVGEGFGVPWPGGDFALPLLGALYLATALLAVRLCGRPVAAARRFG
jgi:uncharacterized membrane protein